MLVAVFDSPELLACNGIVLGNGTFDDEDVDLSDFDDDDDDDFDDDEDFDDDFDDDDDDLVDDDF